MASAISSLGIGSGVLTADVIDQLKEADTSRIVKPLENKITINNQKQDAEKLLSSLMKSFKASASALSYSTLFDNKSVSVDGKAEVSIDAGANVESFTLETTTLAKKDIIEFGSFDGKSSKVATDEGILKINGYEISYNADTTLSELAQSITEEAGSDIEASILQTGDGAYSLVISSKQTGADKAITLEDTDDGTNGSGSLKDQLKPYEYTDDGDDTNDNLIGYKRIQNASDAEFIYNGITVTRTTNDIDDLILGVSISLREEGETSKINISQDKDSITGEMQLFVDSYNTLMSNIHDMTLKDKETGAEGVFNSNSFVKSIASDLSRAVTALNGDNESLMNYGIDIDRYGTMSFNKSVMEEKLNTDSDSIKDFFTGSVDEDGNKTSGIFEDIDDKLKGYTGYKKLLSNFEDDLKTEGKNLSKAHLSASESLDARYAILTKRFIAYDSVISKINAQFSSLQMMINAEVNS
jgi:flagellar hook-associated protein 2